MSAPILAELQDKLAHSWILWLMNHVKRTTSPAVHEMGLYGLSTHVEPLGLMVPSAP